MAGIVGSVEPPGSAPDGIHVMRKLQDELPDLIQEIQEEVAEE